MKVAIIMGSKSDLPYMEGAIDILKRFGVEYSAMVMSVHRTPDKVSEFARNVEKDGYGFIIAGAGFAAHLAGVIAAHTTIPVIGVPLPSSDLKGIDSLLSTVQMPGGIPVATMGIGKSGAKNAALFVVSVLSLTDNRIKEELNKYREEMRKKVEESNPLK